MLRSKRFRKADNRDAEALRALGQAVRERLESDPTVYRMPVDGLEIYGVGEFFSPAECDRLMGMVDEVARPSPTYNNNADGGRTSYSGDFDPNEPFTAMLQRRLDDLLGMPTGFGETMQGQRYAVGQEFRSHYDHFNTQGSYWSAEVARGGQRSWTAMAYLNDVADGGATEFGRVGLTIPPTRGALVIWNNMKVDGTPNPLALHAGTPVRDGVKYVVTKWYRARQWL